MYTQWTTLLIIITLTYYASLTLAYAISPRRYDLIERLRNHHINADTIGCKCIMTEPTSYYTDSTMCLCYNRSDRTFNNTIKCSKYTGKHIRKVEM
ncbi:MAG: hypothetical protein EXX96DRAFT_125195 [Benjaminiella poitrasii]|nr:MAG: hypothetical protein EXX96DRAFT_125195 [Benjaminiella poitrasii]